MYRDIVYSVYNRYYISIYPYIYREREGKMYTMSAKSPSSDRSG